MFFVRPVTCLSCLELRARHIKLMTVENLRVLYLPKENKDVDLDFPTYIDEWWMEMSVRVSYNRSKYLKVNENGGGNNLHILVCSTFIFTSTEFLDKQNCILMVAYC